MIIGITGASGAGKSIASKVFEKNGFFIIDLDKIAHGIYDTNKLCVEEVAREFGNGILDENGKVMRKKLGEIVFADKEKLNILNKITHKYILNEVFKKLDGKNNAVLDAPLLFESGLEKHCDITLGIISPNEVKTKRIQERDGVSQDYAEKRLEKQHSDEFFEKNCTFCIRNNGDIPKFIKKVELFIKNEVNNK